MRNLYLIAGIAILLGSTSMTGFAADVRTSDGLNLTLDDGGDVAGLSVDGKPISTDEVVPLLTVCEVERGSEYQPMPLYPAGPDQWTIGPNPLALGGTLAIRPVGGDGDAALQFDLTLHSDTPDDRGLLVRIGFPVRAQGWHWWDDIQTIRQISGSDVFENVESLAAYAAMPEWQDQPSLRMGYHSKNLCAVITGPVGLSLSIPIDLPRVSRTGFDAAHDLFYITYDVALCRDTVPPSAATFRFSLERCAASTGMRDALNRYYQRHPEMFRKHVQREGMWMAFTDLADIDNADEFRFRIQEGARNAAYDDEIGSASLTYYTHAGVYASAPGYHPGTDPPLTLQQRIDAVEATMNRQTHAEGIYHETGIGAADGNLAAMPATVYGNALAQICLEPELAYGRFLLDKIDGDFASFRERGAELDGYYYDGLTTGINYRRDHFRHAEYPPCWDPVRQLPYLYNYFSSCEFAKQTAAKLHSMGKITMMNGALGATPFCAPHLDIMGAETGLIIPRTGYNYVKTLTHHKPFVTLLKGNFSNLTSAQIELFMKRCLAYGVFPGFFDWPPSGLGPGSRYWDHPEFYERDRPLFRKFLPLVQEIAAAGWEPLTHALVDAPNVYVERYGPADGHLYFALLNDGSSAAVAALTVDTRSLGFDATAALAYDEVAESQLDATVRPAAMTIRVPLGPQGVACVHIAPQPAFLERTVRRCLTNLDLAAQQRLADAKRPARPEYWRTRGSEVIRDAGGLCLGTAQADASVRASQWVMLYQRQESTLRLKARVKAENVSGDSSGAGCGISADLASVDSRFTRHDRRTLPVDPGTYDWLEYSWDLKPEAPLRSVLVTLELRARQGRLWFDDLSLTDVTTGTEYCLDGGFDDWYEVPTPDQWESSQPHLTAVRSALHRLQRQLTTNADVPVTAIAQAMQVAEREAGFIRQEKLENPLRRELRELDGISHALGNAASVVLQLSPPHIEAPSVVVPGDTIAVHVRPVSADVEGPVQYRLESSSGWEIAKRTEPGHYRVLVPADAVPGAVATLHGETIVGAAGVLLPLRNEVSVQVVEPFEVAFNHVGIDSDARQLFQVTLANHTSWKQRSETTVEGAGWTVTGAASTTEVDPRTAVSLAITAAPKPALKPGISEMSFAVTVPGNRVFRHRAVLLHLAPDANRLPNPGFDTGAQDRAQNWAAWLGGYEVDTSVSHSGKRSIRLTADSDQEPVGATQSIRLEQTVPTPVCIRGWSKADRTSGAEGAGYSIYVDCHYESGDTLHGQIAPFAPGTHDWQFSQVVIEPAQPIRTIDVYCMLRGLKGTVWFDDLYVAEDATRGANLARHARVTCDSFYGGYGATPVNDGVTATEGLHWTQADWASADQPGPHSITLKWDTPVTVHQVDIYWSMDAGSPKTARTLEIQAQIAGQWKTIRTIETNEPVPETQVPVPPVTTVSLRIVQPSGAGCAERPDVMWLREVKVH